MSANIITSPNKLPTPPGMPSLISKHTMPIWGPLLAVFSSTNHHSLPTTTTKENLFNIYAIFKVAGWTYRKNKQFPPSELTVIMTESQRKRCDNVLQVSRRHFLEAVEMLTLNPESWVSASGRLDAYGVRAPSPIVTVTVLSLEILELWAGTVGKG